MKCSDNQFIHAGARFITAAALAAGLCWAPGIALAADKDAQEDHAEVRIKVLHAKLKIAPAQEEQWSKVAQAMLDDAKTMDALTQARMAHAKTLTAVDDLKSYGEIAEAHANGIKNLTPIFADLYAGMSESQKHEADLLFREGVHPHKHKKAAKAAAAQ